MTSLPTFTVGQRVLGPHGPGTVIGFEQFKPNGFSADMSSEHLDPHDRVVIKLDPGHTWPFQDQDYYA